MKKRCYYEVLGVGKKATGDEIKQAYRKLAIKNHPDKNPDKEDAREIFQEINEAYQVLSDVNERSWYDNHKEQILSGKQDLSKEDLEKEFYGCNIWKYFNASCYKGFDDNEEKNFYTVYRNLFEKIKLSEMQAWNDNMDEFPDEDFKKLQGFGDSKTHLDTVYEFYCDWNIFSTYKSFGWADVYNPLEAENRWVRRQIEKENSKHRKDARKKYNETIRKLIQFVKKRDPRYQQYIQEEEELEKQKQEDKIKQEKLKKQQREEETKKRREAEIKFFQEEEKQRKAKGLVDLNEQYEYEEEPLDVDGFYCKICSKPFKNAASLLNHKYSKQHQKRVKALIEEVGNDEEILKFEKEEEERLMNLREQAQNDQKPQKQKKVDPVEEKKSNVQASDHIDMSDCYQNKNKKDKKKKKKQNLQNLQNQQQQQFVNQIREEYKMNLEREKQKDKFMTKKEKKKKQQEEE